MQSGRRLGAWGVASTSEAGVGDAFAEEIPRSAKRAAGVARVAAVGGGIGERVDHLGELQH